MKTILVTSEFRAGMEELTQNVKKAFDEQNRRLDGISERLKEIERRQAKIYERGGIL